MRSLRFQKWLTGLRWRLRSSRTLQVLLLTAIWAGCEGAAHRLGWPVPGGILGLFLVLALLGASRMRTVSVRRGARWLVGEMLLFFVPAVMAVVDHREFLGTLGLKLLAVILLGTLAVMAVTALTVEACFRWGVRHGRS